MIDSDTDLAPNWRQASTWTNFDKLMISFSKISIKMKNHFQEMYLKNTYWIFSQVSMCYISSLVKHTCWYATSWIILCVRPANEKWCYSVASSLIGRAHTQNDPCTFSPTTVVDLVDTRHVPQILFYATQETHWNLELKDHNRWILCMNSYQSSRLRSPIWSRLHLVLLKINTLYIPFWNKLTFYSKNDYFLDSFIMESGIVCCMSLCLLQLYVVCSS